MSIEKLRANLAHATKVKSPGHALIASVSEVEAALLDHGALTAEVSRLRQEIADLKDLAYERTPKLMAEQANKQIDPLKAEIERLRNELHIIANGETKSFEIWAKNRARHAIDQKPGELTIKKS